MADKKEPRSLGQIAFEGWWTKFAIQDGGPGRPTWADVPPDAKECWEEAAKAVDKLSQAVLAHIEDVTFTEREAQEVKFARAYASTFAHGTDGHIRLMVIAKYSSIIHPLLIRRDE